MKSFGRTDRGLVREVNEDEVFRSDSPIGCLPNLYIVADGMGGHNAGDVASRNCTRYLVEYIENADIDTDIEQLFNDAIGYANRKLYDEGREDERLSGMGTTVVVATVFGESLYTANVGDSRLYAVGEELNQVTVDHSVVEELYRAGHISEVERHHHPDKNMITRAIGVEDPVMVDFFTIPAKEHTYFMLCTDGLTKMVSDIEIKGWFNKSRNVEAIVTGLTDTAIGHGGKDNITVIVVDLESEGQQ